MGLDGIEILMKVEKTFGINIPDTEAEKIITVGDFHNAVWKHLSGKHSAKCHSQSLFYKLRNSYTDKFNILNRDFAPGVSFNAIFPSDNRRTIYCQYEEHAKLKLPHLVLNKFWSLTLTMFGLAAVAGGLLISIILINFLDYSKWVILLPIFGIFLTIGFSNMLNNKRIEIRPDTIKDFTKATLALNYSELIKDDGTNRQDMESVINHIIADMVGLELDEISGGKKFGDDLGID